MYLVLGVEDGREAAAAINGNITSSERASNTGALAGCVRARLDVQSRRQHADGRTTRRMLRALPFVPFERSPGNFFFLGETNCTDRDGVRSVFAGSGTDFQRKYVDRKT